MKILLHARPSAGFRAQVDGVFGDGIAIVDEADDARFRREMADTAALLHVLTPVRPDHIAGAPRLKLIQKLGVGVNTIALDAAKDAGVAVCNMPGVNAQAVAEMALALLFSVLRRTPYFDAITREGNGWAADSAVLDGVGEVAGRTVGLVGFGNTAARLARAFEALGARVVYTARSAKADVPYAYLPLADLLAESDVVSLHAPLTEETQGMIGRAAIAAMKPGAILVNTARGELVDEAALAEALRSGRLRGAGLDVFAAEPAGADNPLFALPQVVVSPHIAWLTPETLGRCLVIAKENVRRLAAGEPLLNRVV
ncbi:MAG: hydroxyacid dehydrogenase [Sphingomonadaceae bacterium]|nr:hydroxyacid dehydrogenase [Sphingomonadaceae bacterium]